MSDKIDVGYNYNIILLKLMSFLSKLQMMQLLCNTKVHMIIVQFT